MDALNGGQSKRIIYRFLAEDLDIVVNYKARTLCPDRLFIDKLSGRKEMEAIILWF
jgi:hypothetical protein